MGNKLELSNYWERIDHSCRSILRLIRLLKRLVYVTQFDPVISLLKTADRIGFQASRSSRDIYIFLLNSANPLFAK